MSARESSRSGVRMGLPFAAVGAVLSLSFAVLARQAGFTPLQAILTSVVVFAGSAQFAALAVLTGGGAAGAAVAAGTLMNGRFLAMGIAVAPSLPGGPVVRALQGQTMVDASWAMANRGDGTYDRWLMFGSTLPQYVTWVLGSAVGAYAGNLLGNPERFGLDAIFPTFFLAILLGELRRPPGTRRGRPRHRDRARTDTVRPARRTDHGRCGRSSARPGDAAATTRSRTRRARREHHLVGDHRARRDDLRGQGGRPRRPGRPRAEREVPAGDLDDGAGVARRLGRHQRAGRRSPAGRRRRHRGGRRGRGAAVARPSTSFSPWRPPC